jgi:hypothetical protein
MLFGGPGPVAHRERSPLAEVNESNNLFNETKADSREFLSARKKMRET